MNNTIVKKQYSPKDSQTWHERFTKSELQWNDLAHIGRILIPAILLVFSVALYPILFGVVSVSQEDMNVAQQGGMQRVIFLTELILPMLFPITTAVWSLRILSEQSQQIIRAIHNIPEGYCLAPEIRRRLFGVPPVPDMIKRAFKYPFITLKESTDLEEEHWARWFGGPATLVIYDGVAVYVERGNRFSRVLGPGLPMPVLERYETIRAVVDLRPQIRKKVEIRGWTKNGIEVKLTVMVRFQINASNEAKLRSVVLEEGQEATNLLYPFDPDAVKIAVERTAVRSQSGTKELGESPWDKGALGTVSGNFKRYIAAHSLDEMALRHPASPQMLSFEVSDELRDNIDHALNLAGVRLLDLKVGNFATTNKGILEQLAKYWQAEQEMQKTIRFAKNEAESIRANQAANTVAYQEFLDSLIESLQEINRGNQGIDPNRFTESSVLLLTQVLEQSMSDPVLGTFVAKNGLDTLRILKSQLNI